MALNYLVVFENGQKQGGYAGTRYIIPYESEMHFRAVNINKGEKVIAKGVNRIEAERLASLSPHVAILLAAAEDICYRPDGKIDEKRIKGDFINANLAIGLHIPLSTPEEDDIVPEIVVVGPEDTEKNKLFRFILENFNNHTFTSSYEATMATIRCANFAYNLVLDRPEPSE